MLRRRDEGALTLLIIGFVSLAAVLVVVGIDASKVFLARRALSSAADAAAIAAAQAVDRSAVYEGSGVACGGLLPLDAARAEQLADGSLHDSAVSLRQAFAAVDQPETSVDASTVNVRLSGAVTVPFGSVLAWLVPGHGDGRVRVSVEAHARSPLSLPGGC